MVSRRLPRSSMRDGITLYPMERLGNQLFQYAAALSQARRLDVPLYLNLGYFQHPRPKRDFAKRLELTGFDHGAQVPDDPRLHVSPFLALPAVPVARAWHTYVAPRLLSPSGHVFMERSLEYDDRIGRVRPGTTLVGQFQSFRYFADVAEELRKRVSSLPAPSQWYRETVLALSRERGAILCNVRRGDYLQPQNQRVQGIVGATYYGRAVQTARRMGYDGPLYVVSDSLDLAMSELDGLGTLVPIAPPPGTSPLEIMLVVAATDALVAANSSFSWWAGFIGERPGRTVFAPRPWMTSSPDTRHLLPPDWVVLGRD